MDMALRYGQTRQLMRVNVEMEKSMVSVNFNGSTDLPMLDSSITINSMEKASIRGATDAVILVIGRLIKCRDMESAGGNMVKYMRVNLLTIVKRDMEN